MRCTCILNTDFVFYYLKSLLQGHRIPPVSCRYEYVYSLMHVGFM